MVVVSSGPDGQPPGTTTNVNGSTRRLPLKVALALCLSLTAIAATGVPVAADPKPVVYLTFDDGPDSAVTERVLDILAGYNAQATFFVVGSQVAANPAGARRIVDDGHAIANHSYTHPVLTTLSDAAVLDQFRSTNDVVARATGLGMTCYRPPYGAVDARVHGLAQQSGLPNAEWTAAGSHRGLWDIDTQDWRLDYGRTWYELSKVSDGDVVLMHSLRSFSAQVLADWMAGNAHRFEFRALPGCGGSIIEPPLPDDPARWYRYQVARLYVAYFGRSPDVDGARYWNTLYASGRLDLAAISDAFAASPEFANRYRTADGQPVGNRRFVGLVYENVLNRRPDPEGWDYWTAMLDQGRLSRGELMIGFSESTEFVGVAAPKVTAGAWNGDPDSSHRLGIAQNVWPGPGD